MVCALCGSPWVFPQLKCPSCGGWQTWGSCKGAIPTSWVEADGDYVAQFAETKNLNLVYALRYARRYSNTADLSWELHHCYLSGIESPKVLAKILDVLSVFSWKVTKEILEATVLSFGYVNLAETDHLWISRLTWAINKEADTQFLEVFKLKLLDYAEELAGPSLRESLLRMPPRDAEL